MDFWRTILKMKQPSERKPDFGRFVKRIKSNEPGPVPVADIFADFETVGSYLREPVVDYLAIADDPDLKIGWKEIKGGWKYVEQSIRFCAMTGWDYVYSFSMIPFKGVALNITENTSKEVDEGKRGWMDDNRGPIMSWDDFERYPWPRNIPAINAMSRVAAKRVPPGMKVMVIPGGVFEWTTWLMGLVPFSYALSDNPELVDAVIEKVTRLILKVSEDILAEDNVGGLFMGDDLGYSTGTMVSPAVLREKFLPNMKKVVDLTHEAGKVFVLHSCGNMYAIMEDLIEMGVDAKHSYEDKILPADDAHEKWGDRIGIIGGVDMGLMAKGSEEEVRLRTRELLDRCASKGRYVMGTGNSVANYIPLANYLALVDETGKWNRDNFGTEW